MRDGAAVATGTISLISSSPTLRPFLGPVNSSSSSSDSSGERLRFPFLTVGMVDRDVLVDAGTTSATSSMVSSPVLRFFVGSSSAPASASNSSSSRSNALFGVSGSRLRFFSFVLAVGVDGGGGDLVNISCLGRGLLSHQRFLVVITAFEAFTIRSLTGNCGRSAEDDDEEEDDDDEGDGDGDGGGGGIGARVSIAHLQYTLDDHTGYTPHKL